MALNEQQLHEASKMWRDGKSISEIGAHFDHSRSAIGGLMNRRRDLFPDKGGAGKGRPRKDGTPARARPPKAEKPVKLKLAAPSLTRDESATAFPDSEIPKTLSAPAARVVAPISKRLTLTELTERTCKWPIGDPAEKDFHFCGSEAELTASYCPYHAKLAYQPRQASTNRSYR